MINPRGHNHQIALLQPNPHPIVLLAPNIKIPTSTQNIANLLVLVQVLVEEVLDLLLVARQQRGRDLDLVAVLVRALGGDLVHGGEVVGEVVVRDAEGGQVGGVDGAAGVVGEALVALWIGEGVSELRCGWWWEVVGFLGSRTGRLSNQ